MTIGLNSARRMRIFATCGAVIFAFGLLVSVVYPWYVANQDMIHQTVRNSWWRFTRVFTRGYPLCTDRQVGQAFWSWAISLSCGAAVALSVNALLFAHRVPTAIRRTPTWLRLLCCAIAAGLLLPFCRISITVTMTGERVLDAPVAVGMSTGFVSTLVALGIMGGLRHARIGTKRKGGNKEERGQQPNRAYSVTRRGSPSMLI